MDIASMLIGAVLGALLGATASWAIAWYYYRRSAADAADSIVAQRLDGCTDGDKSFLVALAEADCPIPRYALVNVEYEKNDGKADSWASNTLTMARSLNARAPHSLRGHWGSAVDEDRHTISLSERGEENAEHLLRAEFRFARFSNTDDSDSRRLSLFRNEHGRDPSLGGKPGVSITTG